MKCFDLTFSGTVLPEHNPNQVRLAFAKMFSIDDTDELDAIFSGKTIVLKHNLDRKSAAEYFKKITEIGGKAALVESAEPPMADANPATTSSDHHPKSPVRTPAGREAGGRIQESRHSRAREVSGAQDEPRHNLSDYGEELERLRTLTLQTKERSRQRYLAIQGRKAAFQRIADQEAALIEQASRDSLTKAQEELAMLRAEEERLTHSMEAEIGKLERERHHSTQLSREKASSLEALKQQTREREQVAIADIEARREAARLSAERESRRLQQLLADAQRQAELDDAKLEQELQQARSSASQELESLDLQKAQTLDSLEQQIASLLEQQKATKVRLDERMAEHQLRQQELQKLCQAESARLDSQLLDIRTRRDRGIAKVEQASKELEVMTRKNLKKLYAMELQAKRRHNEALGNSHNPGSADATFPEITSH